ncbi:Flp pilus assembly protein [Photobacterium aphoticum]|uniref:Flp pilus assembly protein n=1 Tax=Photobacterium aphoticum TaxID=754436 RepID=A0A090QQ49_9GAMM|nr:Flp pilus assembly protein [Photobacterium aphoticum]
MITKLYAKADAFLSSYKNDERGVTAIEYGLIAVAMAGLLAVVLSNGEGGFIGQLKAAFTKITETLTTITAQK